MLEITEKIKSNLIELKELKEKADVEKENNKKEYINVELQIQDLLHYIESKKFNVVKGFKVLKMLQDLRIKRRQLKIKYSELQCITDNIENIKCLDRNFVKSYTQYQCRTNILKELDLIATNIIEIKE